MAASVFSFIEYPDNKNSNRLTLPKRQTRRPSSSRVPLNCFIITRHVAVVSKQTEFTFQNCPEFFIFPRIDYHICAGVENKKEVGKDTHVRRPIQKNRIIGNSMIMNETQFYWKFHIFLNLYKMIMNETCFYWNFHIFLNLHNI